jgi:hypothetical protein
LWAYFHSCRGPINVGLSVLPSIHIHRQTIKLYTGVHKFLKILGANQNSSCQMDEMKKAAFRGPTIISHHCRNHSCPGNLLTSILLPSLYIRIYSEDPGPSGWGLGVRLTTPPHKKILLRDLKRRPWSTQGCRADDDMQWGGKMFSNMSNKTVSCGRIIRSDVHYWYVDNIQHCCLVMSVKTL